MRAVMVGIGIAVLAGTAGAQEKLSPEHLERVVKVLVPAGAKLADAPLVVNADGDKADGLRKDEVAAVVLPQKGLSLATLEKAGAKVLPLGQLWVRGLTPVTDGKPTPDEKLRIVTVTVGDADHDLPVFLLGVRAGKKGPEMVVYAKGKPPLLTVPLKEVKGEQDKPLELEGRKGDVEDRGILTVKVLGQYQAEVPIARK